MSDIDDARRVHQVINAKTIQRAQSVFQGQFKDDRNGVFEGGERNWVCEDARS